MNDKKQIEEIAQVLHDLILDTPFNGTEASCEKIAKKLLEKYQPKLPENAVVLTKEEYSDYLILQKNHEFIREKAKELQADNERLYKNIGKFKEIVRKETAEKILELLVPDCEVCEENWHNGCLCLRATIAEKIAKQFGVEIKE